VLSVCLQKRWDYRCGLQKRWDYRLQKRWDYRCTTVYKSGGATAAATTFYPLQKRWDYRCGNSFLSIQLSGTKVNRSQGKQGTFALKGARKKSQVSFLSRVSKPTRANRDSQGATRDATRC
jgi:hypothetical protein